MRSIPRHLLLAAVVLTVCCAERQATLGFDISQMAAELARQGQRISADQQRDQSRVRSQRHDERRQTRPAWADLQISSRRTALRPAVEQLPETRAAHQEYPPSRFRLPPPVVA